MGGCCKVLGQECSVRNLGLRFHDSRAFTDSPLPRPVFALLRLLYAALAAADLVWIALDHPGGLWIIHLGNWSRIVTALYFLLGSFTALLGSECGSRERDQYDRIIQEGDQDNAFLDPGDSNSCGVKPGEKDESSKLYENDLSCHHQLLWVLHTLAFSSTFVSMVAYFAFFFEVRYTFLGLLDFPRHVLYLVFLIVDTHASYIPVRLWHVIYAYVFNGAYVVFTVVFILIQTKIDLHREPLLYPSLESGGKPLIYTAILSLCLITGSPVAQIFFYLIYRFRACLLSS
ncbi:uncharacterized protein [Montipora foliosa]|uniref:uncharacterized protein n=1 Tax=Montipora foliosa TaxID=591990 RepID=UPI0035F1D525